MILHTVVPFSCIFPEKAGENPAGEALPPSTDPADYLKYSPLPGETLPSETLPGGILPGEPLPDPADKTGRKGGLSPAK